VEAVAVLNKMFKFTKDLKYQDTTPLIYEHLVGKLAK